MMTAKIFENDRSQAVRLPKEFRFADDEVLVSKIGDVVMLLPKNREWSGFLAGLNMFTDDFCASGRAEQGIQERECS